MYWITPWGEGCGLAILLFLGLIIGLIGTALKSFLYTILLFVAVIGILAILNKLFF